MADIEDGGPAFPADYYESSAGIPVAYPFSGMSLRDYFAGEALALIGGARGVPVFNAGERPAIRAEWVAEQAYLLADAMLKARKEPR